MLTLCILKKNVCDTFVGDKFYTLKEKSNGMVKPHLDLERRGIREPLWMKRTSYKMRKGHPFFTLKPDEKKEFLKFLSSVN